MKLRYIALLLTVVILRMIFPEHILAQRKSNRIIATDYNECLMGIKDSLGNWIVEPKYEWISWDYTGDYEVYLQGKYGIIDSNGGVIIPVIYNHIEQCYISSIFDTTFYRVHLNDKVGIVDRKNRVIVPINYDRVECTKDTMFLARIYKKTWHIYHQDGSMVLIPWKSKSPPAYLGNSRFRVMKERWLVRDKYGMIDDTANVILPRKYDDIAMCIDANLLTVNRNDKKGYCDINGQFIWPVIFDEKYYWTNAAQSFDFNDRNGVAEVYLNGKAGLINVHGDTLLPFEYDAIVPFGRANSTQGVVWKVRKGKYEGVYNVREGWIVPMEIENLNSHGVFYIEPDSSFVGIFSGRKNGLYGLQMTNGTILIPYIFPGRRNTSTGQLFYSRDSVVQFELSYSSTRLKLIPGFDTIKESMYSLWSRLNVPQRAIPSSGRFDVSDNGTGGKIYYHPGHIYDTLFTKDGFHLVKDTVRESTGYNDLYVNGSAFEIRTLKPTREIVGGGSFYADIFLENVSFSNKTGFLVYEDSLRLVRIDPVISRSSDSSHEYIITQHSLLFRDDGKIIIPRDMYSYILPVETEQKDSAVFFYLTKRNRSQSVIDAGGRIIVPEQLQSDVGNFNHRFAWVYRKSRKRRKQPWEVINNASGEVVFRARQEGELYDDMITIYSNREGHRLFNLTAQRFVTTGMNEIRSLNDSGTVFRVRTCSGNIGVIDKTGKYVVDTIWKNYTPVQHISTRIKAGDWYSFDGVSQDYFHYFIFYNDTGSQLFDTRSGKVLNTEIVFLNQATSVVDTFYCELISSYAKVNNRYGPGAIHLFMSQSDSIHLQDWHRQCLYDSLYTHKRVYVDPWSDNNQNVFYSCGYCADKKKSPYVFTAPNDQTSSYNYQSHYISDSLLSFSGIKTNCDLYWFSNAILDSAGAHVLTLDSLFNPQSNWRNFIINTVITYVNSHLYVRGDCHNPAAFPLMLNERFLITEAGIALYPEGFYERGDQLVILIPWSEADPYLRADIRTKILSH